jgi:repressor LexA
MNPLGASVKNMSKVCDVLQVPIDLIPYMSDHIVLLPDDLASEGPAVESADDAFGNLLYITEEQYDGRLPINQTPVYRYPYAIEVKYDAYLEGIATKNDIPPGTHRPQFKKVPMLGYAAAGQPLEDLNQDTPYYDVDNKYDVDFCITVRGDSMIDANINDGDIVFIKSMPEVPNGRIACVEIDNEKVCLKRFYKAGKTVSLASANSKYAPMFFTEDNCENIKVLGLAVLRQSEIV